MINFFHCLTSLTFSYDFFAASITIAKMFSLLFFIHFKFKLSDEEIILFVSFSFSREFGKFDIVRGFVVFCNNNFLRLYYLCVLRIRNELVLPFLINSLYLATLKCKNLPLYGGGRRSSYFGNGNSLVEGIMGLLLLFVALYWAPNWLAAGIRWGST